MFTIEANIDEDYQLAANKRALHEFFANPENFSRYMPDIVAKVGPKNDGRSLWTLKIDVSSGSSMTFEIEMNAQINESNINYEPIKPDQDRVAIYIKLAGTGEETSVNFGLNLRVQRKSSFDIHPLAGLLGERAINKITQSHGEEIVKEFVAKAAAQAGKKKR